MGGYVCENDRLLHNYVGSIWAPERPVPAGRISFIHGRAGVGKGWDAAEVVRPARRGRDRLVVRPAQSCLHAGGDLYLENTMSKPESASRLETVRTRRSEKERKTSK